MFDTNGPIEYTSEFMLIGTSIVLKLAYMFTPHVHPLRVACIWLPHNVHLETNHHDVLNQMLVVVFVVATQGASS